MLPAARSALDDLLDRHEARPGSTMLFVKLEDQPLPSRRDHDEFVEALTAAAAAGAVSLRYGTGRDRRTVMGARLVDAGPLYEMLGRVPSSVAAEASMADLVAASRGTWMEAAYSEVVSTWSKGREWWGVPSGNANKVAKVAKLAAAIVEGMHEGSDYRTFSSEVVKDTKFLERQERAVVQFLKHGRDIDRSVTPRQALSAIGLDRIAVPFHVAGPLTLGGAPLPDAAPYIAVPHEAVSEIGFSRPPRLLLTIENMVSFHRHALEANPGRDDLVVFTGGQPSLSLRRSLLALVGRLDPSTPKLHWSDVDWGGIEIFKTMDRMLGDVRPHLMSATVAAEHGEDPGAPVCKRGQASGTLVASLADWLATTDGRILEQETLDPQRPIWPQSTAPA